MQSVRLQNIRKTFGAVVAVDDVTVEFEAGSLTAVLGPSGCGKTTTLNLIAGFERPDVGTIHFGDRLIANAAQGVAVPTSRRNLGMVFQSYALWPHLTVGENVVYGLKMRGAGRAEGDAAVKQALASVRLEGYLDRYPHELSGGQQQRVALARALAYSPAALLFDEPLSNLDAQLREKMRMELRDIHRRIGVTAIYVTHDQAEAMVLSDRIVVMGEGRIRQIGTPRELYERPANAYVARFIGRTNLLKARLLEKREDWALVRIDAMSYDIHCRWVGATGHDAAGVLSVRPEAIHLKPALEAAPGTPIGEVRSTSYLGNLQDYRVAVGSTVIDVEQSGAREWSVGEAVAVEIDPGCTYFVMETAIDQRPTADAPAP
jgi:iron(III) transport system ATP-binding protein